jgi:hypothetical protein
VLARTGMRGGERVQQPGRRRDPVHDSEHGQVRRHRAEQRVLIAQRPKVSRATAVGKHHREIADHTARIMPGPTLLEIRQAHRQRSVSPLLSATWANNALRACDTSPSRPT